MRLANLALSLFFVTALACDKSKSSEPPADGADEKEKGEPKTLCGKYESCNDCIAGLQRDKGYEKGRAETECGAAVTGCWTTWEKPVKCGDE